jgi:hypothetical protein
MSTTRRSDNERDKHLAETYGKLTKAVEDLVRSEDWVQMLAVAARFHRYRTGNVPHTLSAKRRIEGLRLSSLAGTRTPGEKG